MEMSAEIVKEVVVDWHTQTLLPPSERELR